MNTAKKNTKCTSTEYNTDYDLSENKLDTIIVTVTPTQFYNTDYIYFNSHLRNVSIDLDNYKHAIEIPNTIK